MSPSENEENGQIFKNKYTPLNYIVKKSKQALLQMVESFHGRNLQQTSHL